MLDIKDTQFKLDDAGQIFYQKDVSNPLPGLAVARIVKGGKSLSPDIELIDGADVGGLDKEAALERLKAWIKSHVAEILGPLAALETHGDDEPEAVRAIAEKVYDSMGITSRAALEEDIAKLDADMRRVLRNKKIRLGPVLVFIPALNKPAAVHLRAVLWALWHGRDLPPAIPADGIVSFSVADLEKVDEEYYRAIAYPVYGGRAIRVDMLDRIITAVYDGADKGVFKAKHEMAEWLGSSVPGLYAVLESMGHKKVHDPADDVKEGDAVSAEQEAPTEKAEEPKEEEPKTEDKTAVAKAEPAAKPELATFRLKRGKAYSAQGDKTHGDTSKKPWQKTSAKKPAHDKKSQSYKNKKGKEPKREREQMPKVISAAAPKANPEDSPFAILQRLKTGSKDEK